MFRQVGDRLRWAMRARVPWRCILLDYLSLSLSLCLARVRGVRLLVALTGNRQGDDAVAFIFYRLFFGHEQLQNLV